jgi:glutaredoxin
MSENENLYVNFPEKIVMYSASWCPDCKRSKKLLEENGVGYALVDIGKDNQAFLFVEKLTHRVKIPTLVFPDGTIMIEPSDAELKQKLGL